MLEAERVTGGVTIDVVERAVECAAEGQAQGAARFLAVQGEQAHGVELLDVETLGHGLPRSPGGGPSYSDHTDLTIP